MRDFREDAPADDREASDWRHAEEHPAGYLASRLASSTRSTSNIYSAGGLEGARATWGIPGEARASNARRYSLHPQHGHTRHEMPFANRLPCARSAREYTLSNGPPPGRTTKNFARADLRIYEDVCDRLGELDELDAKDIEVEVRSAEVTLEGTTSNLLMKFLAEQVSSGVSGVRVVHNRLHLRRD